MKNEITTNTQFMFKNEELNKLSEQIASYNGNINASADSHMMTVSNNLCKIAYVMGVIDSKALYKDDGFKSAAEYAMETFDYKKSQAFNLVRVGKKFGERLLQTPYNFTQLVEALPMGAEKFEELTESGEITPDMKVTEIREIAKANNEKPRNPPKVKTFYFELCGHDDHAMTVGPFAESVFMDCGEIYKLKRKNAETVYIEILESGKVVMWKKLEVTESEDKGE